MHPGMPYNPDKDFRLLLSKKDGRYYIQKKRFIFFKFMTRDTASGKERISFSDIEEARDEIKKLRCEHRKIRVGKEYVLLDD